ncbi:transposase, IS605 OrfB family protein [Scytonema sp. HK-05]|uniref:zinc ribbon domain-containing protein n=1 Tax=Scytonema sp. HK-05 TaxID=1137095 RepID=UPI000AB75CA2|nr:transposase, IS605 OrfB family protein [Scytonema sp. HK-05]
MSKGWYETGSYHASISDVGWGMFVNFLDYKLKAKNGQLVEIGRFFPSSKSCSCCSHIVEELTLDNREWDCPSCKTHHDRDGNAAFNIRKEGIRMLENNGGGNPVIAESRQRKTNKPQGGKAVVVETRSLDRLGAGGVGSSQ